MKLLTVTVVGVMLGFLIGISIPTLNIIKLHSLFSIFASRQAEELSIRAQVVLNATSKIYVPTNPKGTKGLAPGILMPESDFYLHRLWGNPSEDLNIQQKYLAAFTVGYDQKDLIDAMVKKFSENFTILLFHYDGRTSEWEEFEWSKRAIHVSARKQSKWWYAKRFLHPDIVACYEYIFIWDEDLGVDHFNAEEYIKVVRKHGLEISQPALEASNRISWEITKRMDDVEIHKELKHRLFKCPTHPHLPPCAAFVEIMAPVFTRKAWRCVWHMIQNDLVHGWGLDYTWRKCVENGHENIGIVDSQWIDHKRISLLKNQGKTEGEDHSQGVTDRCLKEAEIFETRFQNAEKSYLKNKESLL